MDAKTKTTLDYAGPETRHLVIYNDVTLTKDDFETIAQTIRACTKLESLTISGCNLDDKTVDCLIKAITAHPSLTKIDFSNNDFKYASFAIPIVKFAKKVHTLDLSINAQKFSGEEYKEFLAAVQSSDTLAVLKLPSDPRQSTDMGSPAIKTLFSLCNNLLGLSFDAWSLQTKDDIPNICQRNAGLANQLLDKVRSQAINNIDDIKALNRRLPAVINLAEQNAKRSEVIATLEALNQKFLLEFGMSIGIEMYTTESDRNNTAVIVAPAIETPVVELPTIQAVSQSLPTHSEEAFLKIIEEGRNDTMLLMELGKDAVGAIGQISLASLYAMTSAPQQDTSVRSMADFLKVFLQAKEMIQSQANRPATPNALPPTPDDHPQRRQGLAAWLKETMQGRNNRIEQAKESPVNRPDELNGLADAGNLAKQAGQILQEMIPALVGMEDRLAERLVTTHKIMAAYAKVGEQICLIRKVGEAKLAQWLNEAQLEAGGLQPDLLSESENDTTFSSFQLESFPLHVLDSRLKFLERTELQVKGHMANHMLHARVEQKQQEGFAQLRGQNLPLLVEQVSTFMRQVEELQRAAVIDSLANATREAAKTERGTNLIAAIQTLEAIENLAGSTQEALKKMQKTIEEIGAKLMPEPRNDTCPPLSLTQEAQP